MTLEQEKRYESLLTKATQTSLRPSEEIELRDLSRVRIEAMISRKKVKEFNNERPIYEWDYPINKKENE